MRIYPDNEKILYSGRIDFSNPKEPVFVYPATFAKMRFTGNTFKVFIRNHNEYWDNYLGYILDGKQEKLLLPKSGDAVFNIKAEPNDTDCHDIMIFKRQDSCHEMGFLGAELDENGLLLDVPCLPSRKIEVYGDSVSAGEVSEAVEYTGKADPQHSGEYSNSWYSYAWMTARKLNAQLHDVAQGGIALMDNTGWFKEPHQIGMETAWDKINYNPYFGKFTEWDFSKYTPQVVIVAIAQNDNHPVDFMKEDYNSPMSLKWRNHYKELIKKIRSKYPEAAIVCITTLLQHDRSWDKAIAQVVSELGDEKITQCIFKRNASATPGHLRVAEAEEMSDELAAYIKSLHIEGWE